jgi:hypothetical protein
VITVPLREIARFVIVVVVATALVVGYRGWNEGSWPFCCDDSKWTGVFLTNGQAYFGHIYDGPGGYAKLYEVYYVLATQLQSQDPKTAPQTQLSLQRLGGEIHGPTQEMKISKQQILFLEELRPDSPVVQSIRALKQGGQAPQQPAPASTTSAPAATASPSPTR